MHSLGLVHRRVTPPDTQPHAKYSTTDNAKSLTSIHYHTQRVGRANKRLIYYKRVGMQLKTELSFIAAQNSLHCAQVQRLHLKSIIHPVFTVYSSDRLKADFGKNYA